MSYNNHRGTPQTPRLFLALAKCDQSQCFGLDFQIVSVKEEEALVYLTKRALKSYEYQEVSLEISDLKGEDRTAIAYILNQTNEQYFADLTLSQQAAIISNAVGEKGSIAENVFKTVAKIKFLDIPETELNWLVNGV